MCVCAHRDTYVTTCVWKLGHNLQDIVLFFLHVLEIELWLSDFVTGTVTPSTIAVLLLVGYLVVLIYGIYHYYYYYFLNWVLLCCSDLECMGY